MGETMATPLRPVGTAQPFPAPPQPRTSQAARDYRRRQRRLKGPPRTAVDVLALLARCGLVRLGAAVWAWRPVGMKSFGAATI